MKAKFSTGLLARAMKRFAYGAIAEFGFSSSCFGLEEPLCALYQKLSVSARSMLALEKILIAELG